MKIRTLNPAVRYISAEHNIMTGTLSSTLVKIFMFLKTWKSQLCSYLAAAPSLACPMTIELVSSCDYSLAT